MKKLLQAQKILEYLLDSHAIYHYNHIIKIIRQRNVK